MSESKEELLRKVGSKIKLIRAERGYTQVQLADLCDKDKQAIERIENGKINTSIYMLSVIAKALQVNVSELLDGVE